MNTQKIEKVTCITTENEMYEGQPMYKTILKLAQQSNLLQATATKGLAMVDRTTPLHTGNAFQASTQPVLVQAIGSQEDNEAFIKKITPLMKNKIILKEQIETAVLK